MSPAARREKNLSVEVRAALAKLEVDVDALRQSPDFTSILEEAQNGLDGVLSAMRFSSDAAIMAFLKEYDGASARDREIVPWEAFAILAGIDVTQFLGEIMLACRSRSVNVVKIISTTHHPEIVKASIESALQPGGVRDRNALHTALKFLPAAKGATIIALPSSLGALGELEDGGDMGDADPDFLFPNLSDTQKLLSDC